MPRCLRTRNHACPTKCLPLQPFSDKTVSLIISQSSPVVTSSFFFSLQAILIVEAEVSWSCSPFVATLKFSISTSECLHHAEPCWSDSWKKQQQQNKKTACEFLEHKVLAVNKSHWRKDRFKAIMNKCLILQIGLDSQYWYSAYVTY